MDILHHCEKALGGATVAREGKLIGQPIWPSSFLLLVDTLCHSFLPAAVAVISKRMIAPGAALPL
jgi:hypothetical protein